MLITTTRAYTHTHKKMNELQFLSEKRAHTVLASTRCHTAHFRVMVWLHGNEKLQTSSHSNAF